MLAQAPTEAHLARVYFELSKLGAISVGKKLPWPYKPKNSENLFCLACEMSRHDPRLFSVLVAFLASHWTSLTPQKIRNFYPHMQTPQVIGVITEFLLHNKTQNKEAHYYYDYLRKGLTPLSLQYFYFNLYLPGSALASRALERPLEEYKRWGFLAREAPVLDMATRKPLGTLGISSRRNILYNLFKKRGKIKISDYMNALNKMISRQQALMDLKSFPLAKPVGHGRGAFWQLSKKE